MLHIACVSVSGLNRKGDLWNGFMAVGCSLDQGVSPKFDHWSLIGIDVFVNGKRNSGRDHQMKVSRLVTYYPQFARNSIRGVFGLG